MNNADIAQLVQHALTTGEVNNGEMEFVSLLMKLNVPPEWILNENIKQKIISNVSLPKVQNVKTVINAKRQTSAALLYPIDNDEPLITPQSLKRKIEEELVSDNKNVKGWDNSDDE